MATEIILELVADQRGRRLRPATAYDAELLESVQPGEYKVALTKAGAKTGGAKRKWYAGLGLLIDNTEDPRVPTKEKAHELVMRGIGMVHKAPHLRGENFETLVVDSLPDDDESMARVLELARAFAASEWGFDPWQMWEDERSAARAARERLGGGR
jgi:hypothetical protein